MNDCISREAVLEQIKGWLGYELKDMTNPIYYLEKRIKALPSVTPKVIEDIKAEINEGIENYKHKDKAVMFGFMCALNIIDKHVEGWDKE